MMRGEIWWVDFGLPIGSEVGFERPVVILQNDILNESNLMTTVVAPLTSNTNYADFENNLFLEKSQTNLPKDSVVQTHLIIHIDKRRLKSKIGKLDDKIIDEIVKKLNQVVCK